jgi:tetratricopeptide (TPR) repeat protein
MEGVLEKYPTYVECLMYLGNAYTATGMHEEGLEADLRLKKLRPKDPLVLYNLACSFSLMGMLSESLGSLEKAIDLGYDDLAHLANDSDLDSLKNEDGYKVLIHKLKKSSKKDV